MFKAIRTHCTGLFVCSVIGFTGHWLQFGVARLTAWIPAAAGILILLCGYRFKNSSSYLKYLPLLMVAAFGTLTTIMCIRFLPQEFQPLRKKIIFSIMSVSAWATIVYSIRATCKTTTV